MARLILLAHLPLATALEAVARHAFPELAHRVSALDVAPQDSPDEIAVRMRALMGHDTEEILILTDVFGATPANVAQRVADRPGIRILAGVNVPMLWRALNYTALPLDDLLARCMAGATQGVLPITSTRPQNQAVLPSDHDHQQHHHQQ